MKASMSCSVDSSYTSSSATAAAAAVAVRPPWDDEEEGSEVPLLYLAFFAWSSLCP
jgi:hypothetical protein